MDLAAFRAAQARKNAALLASLEEVVPQAPAIPAGEGSSPVKAPRTPKPKSKAKAPAISATGKALVDEREARGLRSSGRIRDSLLGLTPKKDEPKSYAGSDAEEDGYYEDGVFVRTEGGGAPKRIGVRRYDPKRIGAIPGIEVNRSCRSRMEWSTLAVHSATVAGICTGKVVRGQPVAVSICTGGANYGDSDLGESLTYSGSGGRNLSGTSKDPKNLRTAPQTSDMTWDENSRNKALLHSVTTRTPIRVLRSYKGSGPYAPREGYIYSGLYVAVKAFIDKNEDGFDVCRVALVRMPGQPPLAIHPDRGHMVHAPVTMPAQLADISDASSSTLSRTASGSTGATTATTPEPTSRKRGASESASPSKRRRSSRTAK